MGTHRCNGQEPFQCRYADAGHFLLVRGKRHRRGRREQQERRAAGDGSLRPRPSASLRNARTDRPSVHPSSLRAYAPALPDSRKVRGALSLVHGATVLSGNPYLRDPNSHPCATHCSPLLRC